MLHEKAVEIVYVLKDMSKGMKYLPDGSCITTRSGTKTAVKYTGGNEWRIYADPQCKDLRYFTDEAEMDKAMKRRGYVRNHECNS